MEEKTTKKELRAEIDRLTGQVARLAQLQEARELAFWQSLSNAQTENTVTLVMADGMVIRGIVGQVNVSREDLGPTDVTLIVHPQVPR